MTQWIIVALIIAGCLLWILNRLLCRRKNDCCGCDSARCPLRKNRKP